MATVTIKEFGLQAGTDNTLYVTWSWSTSNTENYKVKWYYDTGDGLWFIGSDTTVSHDEGDGDKQSTYSIPSNAKKVKVTVKPVSKKHTVNDVETSYWTASWSTAKVYSVSDNPPVKPPVPDVKIEKYKLTATLDNLDVNASSIQFQIVKDDSTVFNTGTATIKTAHAAYSCTVDVGGEYKVRCRSFEGSTYSDWSEYSSNVGTIPAASSGIKTLRATSSTSIYIEWAPAGSAETYDIEFATKKDYLGASDQSQTINNVEGTHYEKTGLESGQEYFFRVRAANEKGESAWSDAKSILIGKAPAAPTTWSSSTTAVTGDPLTLYWAHNTQDGSRQTYAEIELYSDDSPYPETYVVRDTENDDNEDEEDVTHFALETTNYPEGTRLQWRVRTSGVTLTYSEWSVMRTINIYAPATLGLNVTDVDGRTIDQLTAFPVYVNATPGPKTQTPLSYHLSVVANEGYETTDQIGNVKMVSKGEEIYSKHFDISDPLVAQLTASNIDLENNISYRVDCSVAMDTGLTAEASAEFTVAWTDVGYEPNAEIGVDLDTYTASIMPYCQSDSGALVEGVTLAVYRRDYDGSFTEIASGIENGRNIYVTDPHPALDYARYRIVATTEATGAVSYYDVPGYPVGGKAVILQWSEEWSNFETTNEDELERPVWSGSMLTLPYNIDVSDKHKPDVALIEYIGREHPVGYYGTQRGVSSTWNVDIAKNDKETLYALRRLARWMGDVYVREPSGSGYWANVVVSFSQKHRETTIPVTLDITRVEGGI